MMDSALYWQGVLNVNDVQKRRIAQVVFDNEPRIAEAATKLAVFGFSYKKNTSDTRSTPAASIISLLLDQGYEVSVHDPQVTRVGFELEMECQTKRNFTNSSLMHFSGDNYEEVVADAQAILILTEWDCFKEYDMDALGHKMQKGRTTLYDLRCFLSRDFLLKTTAFDRTF
jgi:UDPglucose 6-dehydrogenase